MRGLWRRLGLGQSVRTLSSLDAYAKWAATYPATAHNVLMQLEQEAVLSLLPDVVGQSVLDLACGSGRYMHLLEGLGARAVVGCDNSRAMLHSAKLSMLAQAELSDLPFAAQAFDGLVCALALGHLPQVDAPLAAISRVLKPNAWALISDFHPFQALNGAERTFTSTDGVTYAVEHYPHLYAEYHTVGRRYGLEIDAVSEPQWEGRPVVLVLRYRKIA